MRLRGGGGAVGVRPGHRRERIQFSGIGFGAGSVALGGGGKYVTYFNIEVFDLEIYNVL